jgi:hypothetical protein
MTSSHLETTAAVAIATRKNIALTHRTIEALKPEAAAYRVPDLRCPGLALRVAPSGYKSWDVAFRIRGAGKVRRLSLGPFPAVGLNDARTKTNTLVSAAKNGRDIVQEEKVAKAVADDRMTVEQLVELYVQRMVRGKLKTASQIELRLNRVLVSLRGQFVDEVRRRDLRKILGSVPR